MVPQPTSQPHPAIGPASQSCPTTNPTGTVELHYPRTLELKAPACGGSQNWMTDSDEVLSLLKLS